MAVNLKEREGMHEWSWGEERGMVSLEFQIKSEIIFENAE